jgi:hypothetical protein
MSVQALSWALREAPVRSKGDLLVLIVLADAAHADGDGAYPSVKLIAEYARMSVRGVHKSLRNLEAAGLIRGTRRPGRVTTYRLDLTRANRAGVQTEQGCTTDTGVCTERPKGVHSVHPNRKEPSRTGGRAQARATTVHPLDEGIIG